MMYIRVIKLTYSLLINILHNLITQLIINGTPSSCSLNSLSGEKKTITSLSYNKIVIGTYIGGIKPLKP